jgi:sugar phosphate isomerase/epimerase
MTESLIDRLAIQSWCFRGYKTHEQVIDALGCCGVRNLEISNAHVNPFTQGAEELAGVLDLYRRAGVNITSTGLFHVGPDEAKGRRALDFVRLCGVKAFTTDIDPGGLEVAERLAREYGVLLAVHNHGRRHRHGPAWALEDLLAATSGSIGICLDTAWMIDSGDDPVAFAAKHASRIYGVHVKDFIFDRAGRPSDVVVGQGNLKLPEFLATLRKADYGGYFTLEYEGDVNDPVPATRQCVEAIRRAWDRVIGSG